MVTDFLHCKMQQKCCPLFNHLDPFLILRVYTVPANIPKLLDQQSDILVESRISGISEPLSPGLRHLSFLHLLYPLTSVFFPLFLPHS